MFTLGRKIDLSYKTNLMIVLFSIATLVFSWLWLGELSAGIFLGGSVFLAWALSRELNPAQPYSAFLTVVFSLVNLLFFETIHILIVLWLLLLLRLVNGITGKKLTLLDILSLFGFTLFLSFNKESSLFLLIFTLAMTTICLFSDRQKLGIIVTPIAGILFIVQNIWMDTLSLLNLAQLSILNGVLITVSSLSVFVFWFLSKIPTPDDSGGTASPSRVFAGQLLFSVAVLLMVFDNQLSVNDQFLYLAVFAGVNLYYLSSNVLFN
ncbi:hypothetical protein GCM10008932_00440 [Alkalibacterium iburiense]|uniref:Uncharacterized protein n=1 Tax=Alkalibacterium iburiense TaxID=290589 RepID=A0ABN0WZE1_9LACT